MKMRDVPEEHLPRLTDIQGPRAREVGRMFDSLLQDVADLATLDTNIHDEKPLVDKIFSTQCNIIRRCMELGAEIENSRVCRILNISPEQNILNKIKEQIIQE